MSSADFRYSPSGALKTCIHCGTVTDAHSVDLQDILPPLGDGCEICDPEDPDEGE